LGIIGSKRAKNSSGIIAIIYWNIRDYHMHSIGKNDGGCTRVTRASQAQN